MTTLLKIDVSPRGEESFSRKLGNRFVTEWQSNHVGGKIVYRDLAKTHIPFVDLTWLRGMFTPVEQHTEEHKAVLRISDELIAELLAADEIVITTPMYNYSIPAVLKAWIDYVVRGGKTFTYGPEGPKGLLGGRKVTVIIASGFDYSKGSPYEGLNHEGPYLRTILGFIGLTELTIVHAGGTSEVARGKVGESAFLDPYVHQVEVAASK